LAGITAERQFFQDTIDYNQKKLDFIELLNGVLDKSNEGDADLMKTLVQEKEKVWGQLDTLQGEFVAVDTHIADLDYQKFAMEQRFTKEDETALNEDKERKQFIRDEYSQEITDLTAWNADLEALKASIEAEGNGQTLGSEDAAFLAANIARIAELTGLFAGIDAELTAFDTAKAAKEVARAEAETKRIADQEIENARLALEQRDRDIKDRKKNREQSENKIAEATLQITESHVKLDEVMTELNSGKLSQKAYMVLDARRRELEKLIEESNEKINTENNLLFDIKVAEDAYAKVQETERAEKEAADNEKWFADYDIELAKVDAMQAEYDTA
jgi:chromosome segregation ATPase